MIRSFRNRIERDSLRRAIDAFLARPKALADYKSALMHSSHKEIYSVRGDAHFELHDYDQAIADYERAMSFSSSFAQA